MRVEGSGLRLLLAIPCHREARRIVRALDKLSAACAAHPAVDIRVVLATNGGPDEMSSALAGHSSGWSFGRVEIYHASLVADKGLAIHRTWSSRAGDREVLAYCDADMAVDPEAIFRGLALIESGGADLVTGSRWHPESVVEGRSTGRTLISGCLSLLWRLLPGTSLVDPGCGLKLVRRADFERLGLHPLAGGFAFGAEVVARLERSGLRLVQIPVRWTDDRARMLRLGKAAWHYHWAWWRLLLRLS